ncbi:2-dehydropantoate 2-reductase [Bradyrhizobium sp. GM2.4]
MIDRVCIWGAGAIGGIVGAHLARAGQDVILVDVADEHVERIASQGLTIDGPMGGFSIGISATKPEGLNGKFGAILLAVKSQHTKDACLALLPHLASDGYVVSLQNGLNEPVIADVVGRDRTIGGFVNFAGDYLEPGRITYGLRGTVAIGELDGTITPRIEHLNRCLRLFEDNAVMSPNIMGYLWGKAAYGAMLTASALTHAPIADFIGSPKRRALLTKLAQEVLDVALAEGVSPIGFDTFEPAAFVARDDIAMNASLDALAAFNRGTGKTHSGIWRDLAVRKRPTEVSAQFQPIEQIARLHDLGVPLFRALVGLISDIENGRRDQGEELADELCRRSEVLRPVSDSPSAPALSSKW